MAYSQVAHAQASDDGYWYDTDPSMAWFTRDGWNLGYRFNGESKRTLDNSLPPAYNKDKWSWTDSFMMTEGPYLQLRVSLSYRDYLILEPPLFFFGETYQNSGTVTSHGSIGAKVFWQDGPYAGTPPAEGKILYFKETKSAYAGFTNGYGTGSASVPDGKQQIMYGMRGQPIGVESIAHKLTQHKVSATPYFTFSSGDLAGNAQASNLAHSISAGVSYYVEEDYRGVSLKCPAVEPNYRKGTNGTREQNRRNEDGSMQADSAATWVTILQTASGGE